VLHRLIYMDLFNDSYWPLWIFLVLVTRSFNAETETSGFIKNVCFEDYSKDLWVIGYGTALG
jgi:hypothetical protein